MKKIFPVVILLVILCFVFIFTACGNSGMKDEMKNELTTLKDGATSLMDDISSAASDMAEELTEKGNVTKDDSSTGLFETMTTESSTVVSIDNSTTENQ